MPFVGIFYSYNSEFFWLVVCLFFSYGMNILKQDYKINKILYEFGLEFSKDFCKIELSFAISDSVCKLLTNKTTYIDQLLTIFSKYS